jgi:hypothetical protein
MAKTAALLGVYLLLLTIGCVSAGPIAGLATYGACQSGCNVAAVACYASAGVIFGTVTLGAGVPAAVAACATQQGVCMAACAVMAGLTGVAPTP